MTDLRLPSKHHGLNRDLRMNRDLTPVSHVLVKVARVVWEDIEKESSEREFGET